MSAKNNKYLEKYTWSHANIRMIPCAILFIGGIITSSHYGNVHRGTAEHRFLALVGVIVFVIFASIFLHILSNAVRGAIVAHRLGLGRAAALQFIIRLFGYLTILITALDHLGIPVGHILLGSAVLGIILGVAAQQALANFFASIVLIISHPFVVGEHISLLSGALGGEHNGTVMDIGLTHTHLKEDDGNVIALPNSTLLTGAAIKNLDRKGIPQ